MTFIELIRLQLDDFLSPLVLAALIGDALPGTDSHDWGKGQFRLHPCQQQQQSPIKILSWVDLLNFIVHSVSGLSNMAKLRSQMGSLTVLYCFRLIW